MNFIEERKNDILVEVVNLTRATLREAEDFKNILTKAIESGERRIVVDLSECEFVDSTFLGSLVVTLKKITSLGGDIKLVGFKPAVRSMFELTRMHKVFETFDNTQDAVNSFYSY
ncbi:MAG: STAS domain-containing protein [Ignavibacteria bacterium]|nr:STAS domain-containing protein [Ignavibacteria bacterium]